MKINPWLEFNRRAGSDRPLRFRQLRPLLVNAVAAVAIAAAFIFTTPAHAAVPAFPGAQGGGAASVGGRGGTIMFVTTLADSGAGSLRACVDASGARTCVFRIGGTISLSSSLEIRNPYITIAGQTAPGGGIQLRGTSALAAVIRVHTNDVVIRYLRVRHGRNPSCSNECGGNIMIHRNGRNVVLDHISAQWNQDEGIGTGPGPGNPTKDVTVSWSLVGEGLGSTEEPNRATGMTFSGGPASETAVMTNMDIHNTLVMTTSHRNPLLRIKSSRMVNNLFYNQKTYVTHISGGITADIIGSKFTRGPLAPSTTTKEIGALAGGANTLQAPGDPSLYLQGNIGWHQSNPSGDQYLMAHEISGTSENGTSGPAVPASWRRSAPMANTAYPITATPVANLEALLLPIVGASRRLDTVACNGNWVGNRDTQDAKMITQYTNGTGPSSFPTSEAGYGGYPTIANGTPCTDADDDGMADAWEIAKFGSITAKSNNSAGASGFTVLEEYISGEFGVAGGTPPPGTYPAESAVVAGGCTILDDASGVTGYNGTGFVNFPGTGIGTLTFNNVDGGSGGAKTLVIRFGLGAPARTGELVVNGVTSPITFPQSGPTFSDWADLNVAITLNSGTANTIQLKSTGQDLANIDEITIQGSGGDTTPPTVSITAPASGATVSGSSVTVSANASDNVGVVGVQFKLDGANLGAEDTSSPYSIAWNSTTATNGSHTLTAVARDAAGNSTTSAGVSVTVSNPPAAPGSLTATVAAAPNNINQIDLSWTNVASETGYKIERKKGVAGTYSQIATTATDVVTYSDTTLGAGTQYYYRVRAYNGNGDSGYTPEANATTAEVTSGRQAHWKLDEGSGTTAADASGNGNTGTLANGPTWVAGKIGNAVNFDAVDDVVNVGSPATLDDLPAITIAAWIKPNSIGESAGRIVHKGTGTAATNGWQFVMIGTNSISFAVDYSTTGMSRTSVANAVSLGAWQHVIMTWTGSATATNVKLYVNGVETAYDSTSNGVGTRDPDAASSVFIGNNSTGVRTFDGPIDDVRIYNRVLTASEIQAVYRAGL